MMNQCSLIEFTELLSVTGFSRTEVIELVECGALEPSGQTEDDWQFPDDRLFLLRKVARLREDFELSTSGIALVLSLLEHIEMLQHDLRKLQSEVRR